MSGRTMLIEIAKLTIVLGGGALLYMHVHEVAGVFGGSWLCMAFYGR